MRILKHIPNALTSLNLATGCLGILLVLQGYPVEAAWFVWLACLFDFFDGFAARLFKVSGNFGKELDSLADMVSFGVLPAVQMFLLLEQQTLPPGISYLAILIAVFSALRLAKFNIDTRQTQSFIGVPTPANALFITALPFLPLVVQDFVFTPYVLVGLTVLTSLWLVAEFELFALKFSNFTWRDNKTRFTFLILAALLLVLFQAGAMAPIIILYVFISLVQYKKPQKPNLF
ncbi:MAG: CDP-diacylglycerol--serine O-phosphatidyltransferase [Cyclobacteriaceae bacterium]|jgi:CDP-diacylglycerol--serine O-phosphatidyltransferase|nr:CDP-diacylglycerol--serine O-phosphatidyltransferase [Cyclobacteriaceae bacterium]